MLTRKGVIEVLKTGKFYIYIHDNDDDAWSIYDVPFNDYDIEDWDEWDEKHKIYDSEGYGYGYVTSLDALLVEALGGKIDSV